MSYLPTIVADIARAKKMIDDGAMTAFELERLEKLSEAERQAAIDNHGSISSIDAHVAYRLLKSFVEEIERLQKLAPALKPAALPAPKPAPIPPASQK